MSISLDSVALFGKLWPTTMMSPDEILSILDRAADVFAFPMLDNGYVYLAATRMRLFRSSDDWALVIEVFGFSPRAGIPSVSVQTYASRLRNRDAPDKYRTREAYDNYLLHHPYDEFRSFDVVDDGPWHTSESDEEISSTAESIVVRGRETPFPTSQALEQYGIELSEPPTLMTFELCRYLAAEYRDRVLATPEEARVSVPLELEEILCLDAWAHPDLCNDERPSGSETFQQIARVLSSGEVSVYQPTVAPNTHWRHWPEGGSL